MSHLNISEREIIENMIKLKKAQSEMIGFALIIIIVAVLILVFLSISLNKPKEDFIESYGVEGFVQGFLQHTTTCAINYEPNYQDVRKLIFKCAEESNCLDGTPACDVLNQTLNNLSNLSWHVGPEWPNKGYALNITSNGEPLLEMFEGNATQNSKGSIQSFSQGTSGKKIDIYFVVYS